MYLIKNIIFDCRNNSVIVENGIKIKINDKHAIVKDEFWGETEINFGIYADLAELSECDETYDLLSYTSEYQIQNTRDEYKKIILNISTYDPEKNEGYIVFIKNSPYEIQTKGKKIFGRYPNEIVAVLTNDGDYIKVGEKTIELINNELMLKI